jgi:autotransporter translocation and assembly factor TamB
MWDPVAYSLHWQSIPLADLSVDASEVEAAADVSLVSGKVRCSVSAAVTSLLNRRAHASRCSCVRSRSARPA